ncbi:hypothetical protein NPIL_246031 [Nephila pilipes]|uniref:Uncharacterized protein n=1 Tax=Nephila pilipes TaxID=299642 RepID=A0A8X6J7V4_NEPPI|nr:hypothetical protein NPIL_246031 [Nephila pilipes]
MRSINYSGSEERTMPPRAAFIPLTLTGAFREQTTRIDRPGGAALSFWNVQNVPSLPLNSKDSAQSATHPSAARSNTCLTN